MYGLASTRTGRQTIKPCLVTSIGNRRRRTARFLICSALIHRSSAAQNPGEQRTHRPCSPPELPSDDAGPPEPVSSDRCFEPLPRSRPGADGDSHPRPPSRPHHQHEKTHVAAFVVGFMPGTTRKHPNGPPLPCSGHRRAPARFYLRHTPRLGRLNHLPDTAGTEHHPGSPSPSSVSNTLHAAGHVA